jgi:putative ATP-dependent endonuclease of the OLD family
MRPLSLCHLIKQLFKRLIIRGARKVQLSKVEIQNFRLLHNVALQLEDRVTVIVGRNNCGKTSLTEVLKRFLSEGTPSFRLEDFSFLSHEKLWDAFIRFSNDEKESDIRKILPAIEVRLTFTYGSLEPLGSLGEFVVDLNPNCVEALIVVKYRLKDGKLKDLFADLTDTEDKGKTQFFRTLRDRIPSLFVCEAFAVDPNDPENRKAVELTSLRRACAAGCISAQRGLDDASQKDRVVIGKVLENLFATAKANVTDAESHTTAQELEAAVKDIQDRIDLDFNKKLDGLLPALSLFGYPGLNETKLMTETILDVARLLTNHTKVRYSGNNGVHLPESYNGLGVRNLILMLLQIREFYKTYLALETKPAAHLIFVEEPEVHLHPQMQEVFIRKLAEIAKKFSEETKTVWPVQFVVTTHSSHIANEAHFETVRYFLCRPESANSPMRTVIKDLRNGLVKKGEPDRTFLHQYMTLTRCDLYFADKAILIEGTTERLLLPKMISNLDGARAPGKKKLSSQYVSVIEVGGAYAHIFFDLVEFLELHTLIITDLDSVKKNANKKYEACLVSQGERSSNACINTWFGKNVVPTQLTIVKDSEKIAGFKRIAYEIPEVAGDPCGRSFEDAFMLANKDLFPFAGENAQEKEQQAWDEAQNVKKSEFALDYALAKTGWTTPRYILEGLEWLADAEITPASPVTSAPK